MARVRIRDVLRSRRLATLCGLGFAAGLPLAMTAGTLTAWLADVKVNVETIALFSAVGLGYTFKWVWAPLFDRFQVPWLGRRRGWILTFQLGLIATIATMGAIDPHTDALLLGLAALATGVLSASQDIVIDAHRADLLSPDERPVGTAAYVLGYRIALLLAGTFALILADLISWRVVYWIFAGSMGLGIVATLAAEEPSVTTPVPSLANAVWEPFERLFTLERAAVVLAFVALFKFSDGLMSGMFYPFTMQELGFQKTELALFNKVLGFGGTAVGISVGAALAVKMGLRWSLLLFGALQALTNLLYTVLGLVGKSYVMLVVAVFVDNAANSMGDAAFLAFLLSLTTQSVSGTQYAFLSAASSVGKRVFGWVAGPAVTSLGYPGFYALSTALALPALILILFLPLARKDAPAPATGAEAPAGASAP